MLTRSLRPRQLGSYRMLPRPESTGPTLHKYVCFLSSSRAARPPLLCIAFMMPPATRSMAAVALAGAIFPAGRPDAPLEWRRVFFSPSAAGCQIPRRCGFGLRGSQNLAKTSRLRNWLVRVLPQSGTMQDTNLESQMPCRSGRPFSRPVIGPYSLLCRPVVYTCLRTCSFLASFVSRSQSGVGMSKVVLMSCACLQ